MFQMQLEARCQTPALSTGQFIPSDEPPSRASPYHNGLERSMQLDESSVNTSTSNIRSIAGANLTGLARVSKNDGWISPSVSLHSQRHEGTAAASSLAGETAEVCMIDGCKHKGSFKSAHELARHVKSVHGGDSAKVFVCGAHGCFNGCLPWSFARSDKLTSHIKATHRYDTIFNQCPVAECSFGPCTLEVLGVHIKYAHRGLEEGRAILNATPCKARRCPLWRCGKHVATDKLMSHVIAHASEDIEAAKSTLELEGFFVEGTSQSGITVRVVCPVCRAVTADPKQFFRHLANDHLYASSTGGIVHFEKWKAYWENNAPRYRSEVKDILPWSRIRDFEIYVRKLDYHCPCCPFSVMDVGCKTWVEDSQDQRDKRTLIREHHLSLLRPEAEVVAELYPHRMAILRFCPRFVTHPVFADFDKLPRKNIAGLAETQDSYVDQQQDDFEIPRGAAGDFNSSA